MANVHIAAPAGVPQIITSAEFDAPRYLVFRAFMEPELLSQWLGPRRLTMTIDEHDPRDGGRYRYVHRDAEGNKYVFRGVFHGDPTPDGAVQTFEFEGAPGHVSLDTLTLEEHNGRTIVTTNSVFQSVADRDAMIANGMEVGVREGYELLDELLQKLKESGRGRITRAA